MPKRGADSDDSDYREEPKPSPSPSPKKPRTPKAPKTRRIAHRASSNTAEDLRASGSNATPEKKKGRRKSEEQGSSPSKALLEAEVILAQYSPGTKRTVKVSDLKKLRATHEERRQEALSRVEKQKEVIEERRKEIFSRLAGLGYSQIIIEKDVYDHRTVRARWWQLVEEPQELTKQAWEKIHHDLCIILDKRQEVMSSDQARANSSMSSSPSRPKKSAVHTFRNAPLEPIQTVRAQTNDSDTVVSKKRRWQEEADNIPDDPDYAYDPMQSNTFDIVSQEK